MASVEGGRQCARCDRRLLDFRGASDDQIVRAHAENDAPVCGAYSPEQVARWANPRPILVSLTLGASLLGAASAAHAASAPAGVHSALSVSHRDADTLIVRGVVSDSAGAPLRGVLVRVEGAPVQTVTDSRGRYTIRVPGPRDPATPVRLRFGLIGYMGRNVEIGAAPDEPAVVDVVLTRAELHIVGIVITAYPHRNLRERIVDWVRGIF
ncbi:MAG TPA: carboxypeptidase regulatory-like domain-containing protein [Longimicrobium sp.]|nr:carboxypeptidase regulatory-like domain-containing protein [Longimicrobium sp.]